LPGVRRESGLIKSGYACGVPVHSLETPVCAYAAIDMVAN
jgi:hypothetical protein